MFQLLVKIDFVIHCKEIQSLYLKPEEQFGQLNLAEELIVFVPTLISQNDLIPFHGSYSFYLYLGSHTLVPSPISTKQIIQNYKYHRDCRSYT